MRLFQLLFGVPPLRDVLSRAKHLLYLAINGEHALLSILANDPVFETKRTLFLQRFLEALVVVAQFEFPASDPGHLLSGGQLRFAVS